VLVVGGGVAGSVDDRVELGLQLADLSLRPRSLLAQLQFAIRDVVSRHNR
jgi:hypothetical protein